MHTTVYKFWRFVYHPEQSVIDHYARSSFYTRSFCTAIKLYVGHFLLPLTSMGILMSYFFINMIYLEILKTQWVSSKGIYSSIKIYFFISVPLKNLCHYQIGQFTNKKVGWILIKTGVTLKKVADLSFSSKTWATFETWQKKLLKLVTMGGLGNLLSQPFFGILSL